MFDGKTEYCLNEAGEYISTATTKQHEAEERRQWVTLLNGVVNYLHHGIVQHVGYHYQT